MKDPTPHPFRSWLADEIERRSEELTRSWLSELERRLEVSSRRIFPTDRLLDDIPLVIRALAGHIRRGDDPTADRAVLTDLVRLARLRRRQGYDAAEVLQELAILSELFYGAVHDAAASYAGELRPPEVVDVARRTHQALVLVGAITNETYRRAGVRERSRRARLLALFGRTLAHELKNPISSAMGAADLLEVEDVAADPERRSRLTRVIKTSLEKADNLISDVRALAISQENPEAVEGRYQRLPQLVDRVLDGAAYLARDRGVRLEVERELPDVHVDASRVELALVNLVSNAVRYSDPDKPERWVKVSCEEDPDEEGLVLAVEDNGLGIPEEERTRVFEGFVRAHPGVSEGTGLGLTIVREVVRQLGSRVRLDSEPGRGSRFWFRVPLPEDGAESG